jgi:hypothetical protein
MVLPHLTCICGTCGYSLNASYNSSVTLGIHHRNLRSVFSPCDGTLLRPVGPNSSNSSYFSFVTLAIHHRSLHAVLSPCGGTLLHSMCTYRTCSYSSMTFAVHHRSLRSVLSPCNGTLLHLTCTCGTCSYSSVTLAFRHRSLHVPVGPFSIRCGTRRHSILSIPWDPSPSDVYLWDLQLLICDACISP